MTYLPTDSAERKRVPLARGMLDYFPAALAEVARLSLHGNEKHNPGDALHHARGKSGDHADCIMRHLVERGSKDADGFSHSVKVAWRALAMLQEELEAAGAPLARAARLGVDKDGNDPWGTGVNFTPKVNQMETASFEPWTFDASDPREGVYLADGSEVKLGVPVEHSSRYIKTDPPVADMIVDAVYQLSPPPVELPPSTQCLVDAYNEFVRENTVESDSGLSQGEEDE